MTIGIPPERTRATGGGDPLERVDDIFDLYAFVSCNALEYCGKRTERQIVVIGHGDSLKARVGCLKTNVTAFLGDETIIPMPTIGI
jgi:hypothetical protein